MKNIHNQQHSHGFTLIELLLYIAITGSLLISITYFFALTAEARVKNQSVSEVNDQAAAVMDYMTQTIRNATSITSPAAGASAASLTLVVPTGSLSPTIFDTNGGGSTLLGVNTDGGTTDGGDSGSINATKFVASASGTITSLNALIGPTVAASPNNKAQMAIYSGTTPTTFLASSASVTITPNAWASFSISSVNITSGQTYWLAYNTNGLVAADNGLRYVTVGTSESQFITQTFTSWPSGAWTGTGQNARFSMYATITTGGSGTALQVKEGTGAVVPLTSTDVQISNLTFKNLTKSGTAGIVQISFTLTRTNPNSRNEYDFQKTFTTSAEIGW